MHTAFVSYRGHNLSDTSLTISAVAPFRTGLQLMINAFIIGYLLAYEKSEPEAFLP